jgi:hypothetical protein
MIIPDCLILKLQEVDLQTNKVDTELYIIYDQLKEKFVLRGQRYSDSHIPSNVYSFECSNQKALLNFISYVICKNSIINETLYNYDNLPQDSATISFDFLKIHEHVDYEVSGYNNIKFNKKRLRKLFNILLNVFNLYY